MDQQTFEKFKNGIITVKREDKLKFEAWTDMVVERSL